jgi:hypothetical protein
MIRSANFEASPHGRAGVPGDFGGGRTSSRREVLVTTRGEREATADDEERFACFHGWGWVA